MTAPILRCFDATSALLSLAGLFTVSPEDVAGALPDAAVRANADTEADYPAHLILPELEAALGRPPETPSRIHYFHGTRTFDLHQFRRRGLLPLSMLVDDIWNHLRELALGEIDPDEFIALRRDLAARRIDALNYAARVRLGPKDDGPHAVLVRELLFETHFIDLPETVENICVATREVLGIDLMPRYRLATTPCIVEFTAAPLDATQALRAACWYVEAALRNDPPGGDASWNFSGDGAPVPPEDIVDVEQLDPTTLPPSAEASL